MKPQPGNDIIRNNLELLNESGKRIVREKAYRQRARVSPCMLRACTALAVGAVALLPALVWQAGDVVPSPAIAAPVPAAVKLRTVSTETVIGKALNMDAQEGRPAWWHRPETTRRSSRRPDNRTRLSR
jgi:hypothetical protein